MEFGQAAVGWLQWCSHAASSIADSGAPARDRSINCASRFLAPGFWSISAPEIPRIA